MSVAGEHSGEDHVVVWELPHKSQEFMHGPKAELTSVGLTISYDYERPAGDYAWADIDFQDVVGFKFTASEYCSVDQVRAYDKVVRVENSMWQQQLRSNERDAGRAEVSHFRVYFDEGGCFDVLAAAFAPPP